MTTATATATEYEVTTAAPPATAAETPAPARSVRDFVDWLVEPHLVGNRIVAAGRVKNGARVSDVLAANRPAFGIYRLESRPGNLRERVALIVPRRADRRPWPDTLESAQVITAEEYCLSDTGFMICANLGRMLSDEDRHRLAVWGDAPEGSNIVLAETDIGRYIHRKLPQISFGTLLQRWLVRFFRQLGAVFRQLARMFKLAGITTLAIIVIGLAIVGGIVVIQPELMGLEIIDKARWLFSWLPWH